MTRQHSQRLRILTRENLKLVRVGAVILLVAWTGPTIAHGVHARFAHNADKVDGRHAVGAAAGLRKARGKLVAHNKRGTLPARFLPKVKDADRVDGISSRQLQFPRVVPPGHTVTGGWGFRVHTDGEGFWGTSIDFPARLPSFPDRTLVIDRDEAPTADCPGSYMTPKAAPGRLCVYLRYQPGFRGGFEFAPATTLHGALVHFWADERYTNATAAGSYAYRAPR